MTTNPCHPNATAVDVKDHVIPHGAIHGALTYEVSSTPDIKAACFLPDEVEKVCGCGESFFVKHKDEWHMAHFPEGGKLVGPMIFGPGKVSEDYLLRRATSGYENAFLCFTFTLLILIAGLVGLLSSGAQFSVCLIWFMCMFLSLYVGRKSLLASILKGKHLDKYLKLQMPTDVKHVYLPKSAHGLLDT